MRILLIEPAKSPVSMAGEDAFLFEPLALEYLAAGVGADHEVRILDQRIDGHLFLLHVGLSGIGFGGIIMPAKVDPDLCSGCEECVDTCPVEAISMEDGIALVSPDECTECQACIDPCPTDAILMVEEDCVLVD